MTSNVKKLTVLIGLLIIVFLVLRDSNNETQGGSGQSSAPGADESIRDPTLFLSVPFELPLDAAAIRKRVKDVLNYELPENTSNIRGRTPDLKHEDNEDMNPGETIAFTIPEGHRGEFKTAIERVFGKFTYRAQAEGDDYGLPFTLEGRTYHYRIPDGEFYATGYMLCYDVSNGSTYLLWSHGKKDDV